MNVLITGGTGSVGKVLAKKLKVRNHSVHFLTRSKAGREGEFHWDLEKKFIDPKAFENLDSIIHLAGASISERWSEKHKKAMYESRIDSANLLHDYCLKEKIQLKSFISASGINYYGTFTSDKILDENDGIIQSDFLAELCEKWEAAAEKFNDIAERTVCMRTAMVLDKDGGALPMLKKTVDFNVGSAVGSGKQWMNWLHIDDLTDMYVFALENEISGSFNAVADDIPDNEMFMKTLAKTAGKVFLPINVPAFMMKIIFGEMSSIILEGTRASNKKIKSQGFNFKYNSINQAFADLVK